MKYICLGYSDEKWWDERSEDERNEFVDKCFAYDDTLMLGGYFAGGEALQSSKNAITLGWRNGSVVVTDGPYAETKEQIGGIMILEAIDLNDAVRIISNHPSLRFGNGHWEIRPAADLTRMIHESNNRQSAPVRRQ